MSFTTLRLIVAHKVQDTAHILKDTDYQFAIESAVTDYSSDSPRTRVAPITGDGSTTVFPLPADAVPGPSAVQAVEYPIEPEGPTMLDEDDFIVRPMPDESWQLQLLGITIATGAQALIYYPAPHVVSLTEDTIPAGDRYAVASLAAAYLARTLAAYYSQTSDPSIAADAVSYRTKMQEYLMLAKDLAGQYDTHMSGSSAAANVNRDLDMGLMGTTDTPRFYHGRR